MCSTGRRFDVCDCLLLARECKDLGLLVHVVGLVLLVLKGLVDELHVQLPLAPLPWQARLRAHTTCLLSGRVHQHCQN